MEEKKLFDLRLEIKEIAGGPPLSYSAQIEICDKKESIQGRGQVSFHLAELSSLTPILISIFTGEKQVGFSKLTVSSLFSDNLQGRLDRWIKIRSDEFQSLRIKLSGSLAKPEKSKSKTASVSSRRSGKQKDVKCPFLDNLSSGKEINDQSLNELWRHRNDMTSYVKLSFEPDSPGRLEVDRLMLNDQELEELSLEKITKMPGSQLKQLVKILCEESKQLTVISENLPEIREKFQAKIKERRDLEQKAQEEMNEIKEKWTKNYNEGSQLYNKRNELKTVLAQKQEESKNLELKLDTIKACLEEARREKLILDTEKILQEDTDKSKNSISALVLSGEQQKTEFAGKLDKAQKDFKEALIKANADIAKIKSETEETKAKIDSVNNEHKLANENNEILRKKINETKAKLHDLAELKKKSAVAWESLKSESEKRDELNSQFKALFEDLAEENQRTLLKQQELVDSKKEVNSKIAESEEKVVEKEQAIIDTRKQIISASADKICQEQICCVRADLAQLIEDLNRLNSFHTGTREVFLKDLEAGSRILFAESSKVHANTEKLDHMIDVVDKKEEELDGLKNTMGEVNKRVPPYVPVKDDSVDVLLAEYLNSRENPVPVKFIRQEGGNYLFGSKKVYIKYENSKLLVKVGGGFTGIDEFLCIYTPVELEKGGDSPKGTSGFMSLARMSGKSPVTAAKKMGAVFESLGRKG